MMAVEGMPESTTAEQYIAHAVRALLVEGVEWQARSVAAGFSLTLDPKVLRSWCLDAEALAAVLDDGSGWNMSDMDIQKAFRVVMDKELTKEGAFLGKVSTCQHIRLSECADQVLKFEACIFCLISFS
jgi:hypothetical protein